MDKLKLNLKSNGNHFPVHNLDVAFNFVKHARAIKKQVHFFLKFTRTKNLGGCYVTDSVTYAPNACTTPVLHMEKKYANDFVWWLANQSGAG